MIQICYPENRKKFEEDYKEKFNFNEDSWYKLIQDMDCCTKRVFKNYKIESFDDLIIAPFDILLEIYKAFPKQKIKKDNDKKRVKSEYEEFYEKLFEYDGTNQKNISKFFMDYSKKINLKTCYFCNIDFINVFATRFDNVEYKSVLDIIKIGNKDDLKLLKGIDSLAEKIVKKKDKINRIEDLEKEIDGIGGGKVKILKNITKKDLDKIDFKSQKNHFTLDHFLPKSKCPILALSLYNFVPSCSSCNTKFKTVDNLGKEHLSPTSSSFSVQDDIKFKFFFDKKVEKDDLNLSLTYSKNKDYKKYIEAFELENRYKFHQNEALALIERQEIYSETRIDEIANILEISPHQVKKDIFGEELFSGDLQDKSFTKMKRDVARNIGIRGVKDET